LKRTLGSILLLVLILTSSVFVSTAFAAPNELTPVIVGFKGLPDAALIHAFGGQITHEYNLISAIACSLPAQAVNALQKNPHIAFVEADFEVTALEYKVGSEDWGITKIGASIVHSTNMGSGIIVGVIDTGINKGHADLKGNYVKGWDFVNNDNDPNDDNGHGTHCAGIIAAAFNYIAVVGVAPEASIYAYKVLDSRGSGTVSNIIAGIDKAVLDGVDVISLSLGSTSYSLGLETACKNAVSKGVVVVAAAGNSGNTATGSTVIYPARTTEVIAVGATDVNDVLATFSSTGPEVDVVAPGVYILSDYKDVTPRDGLNQDTWTMSGTSMACPHVAGTAALMLSANPSLTPAQVKTILQDTAQDLGTVVGFDNYYGYGRIDASHAVTDALTTTPDTTPPAQVAGLTATAISATQINLEWTANTETDLKGYNIYRGSTATELSIVTFVAAPTHIYLDAGVAASTTYYYKVAAVDQSQNEGTASIVASATTPEQPAIQPLYASITMALKTVSQNTYATATVTIRDASSNLISGAIVTGQWSGATTDKDTATTNTNGVVTLQSNNVKRAASGTVFTITITNVVLSGYTYTSTTTASITKP
jgi:subtilisin